MGYNETCRRVFQVKDEKEIIRFQYGFKLPDDPTNPHLKKKNATKEPEDDIEQLTLDEYVNAPF